MKSIDIDKYNHALFFAQKAHGEQKMKFPEDAPYIVHCVGVANSALVASENDSAGDLDKNLIAQVALLHDTIEDTNVSFLDIKKEFGESVAKGVLALSKDKDLQGNAAMVDSIKRIKQQPREISIIKLADRCFNTRCLVPTWPRKKQLEYIEESKMILQQLGNASNFLAKKLQNNINNLTNELYQGQSLE